MGERRAKLRQAENCRVNVGKTAWKLLLLRGIWLRHFRMRYLGETDVEMREGGGIFLQHGWTNVPMYGCSQSLTTYYSPMYVLT